jgi:hypothetical protein
MYKVTAVADVELRVVQHGVAGVHRLHQRPGGLL